MIAALTFAFVVGVISSVNPCGFALLPAYFARRLGIGTEDAPDTADAVARALAAGAATTLGVVLVFGVIGAVIVLGAAWLASYLPWAGFVIGLGLVVIGIIVLSGRHVGLRLAKPGPGAETGGVRGDFYFGLGYGTASLTCTLPIFLSVTSVALTGSLFLGGLGFIAFGLGMGTILTAIAVAAALSRDGLARNFKRFVPYANRAGGAVLVLAGAYVITYWGTILFSDGIPAAASVVGIAEQISGRLRTLLGGEFAPPLVAALLVAFAGFYGWNRWRRGRGAAAARRAFK